MDLSPTPHEASQDKNASHFWKELLKLVLLAVVIVIPFRFYVAQPFIVEGLSMYPTFDNGHYLIIDELSYRFKAPERGSVLIFRAPNEPQKKYYIKRVIGLPFETVKISNGQVTIINDKNPDGFKLNEPYVKYTKTENLGKKLGDGEYFVMGDNRAASSDSRVWGAMPEANIVGRPIIRVYPPDILPGNFKLND